MRYCSKKNHHKCILRFSIAFVMFKTNQNHLINLNQDPCVECFWDTLKERLKGSWVRDEENFWIKECDFLWSSFPFQDRMHGWRLIKGVHLKVVLELVKILLTKKRIKTKKQNSYQTNIMTLRWTMQMKKLKSYKKPGKMCSLQDQQL